MSQPHNDRLAQLSQAGVSIWLDDLDRHRIESGNLAELIATHSVVGVTTNPSIFDKALTSGVAEYSAQLKELALSNASADEAIRALTVHDVTAACDIFAPTFDSSGGIDGRVSLEVDPRLANDTAGTVNQAVELWNTVNRPNLLIKIPATLAGLPAITDVIAQGISVNVTLIFSVERYEQVLDAWLAGLEKAKANNVDISHIESVASFFISRVDTLVDAQLDAMKSPSATNLRGTAAIANAQLAWDVFTRTSSSARWTALAQSGARIQRPLWASTGVKDASYDNTRYVVELVAPQTVNTMPEATLNAVADHGVIRGNTLDNTAEEAHRIWDALSEVGIDREAVFTELERDGVEKFSAAWDHLLESVKAALASTQ